MKDSNDLYAAHHNPVKVDTPRILRRREAISLLQSNLDIEEDVKMQVVKQFVHDSDKGRLTQSSATPPWGRWSCGNGPQRGSSSLMWAGVRLRPSCSGAGSVYCCRHAYDRLVHLTPRSLPAYRPGSHSTSHQLSFYGNPALQPSPLPLWGCSLALQTLPRSVEDGNADGARLVRCFGLWGTAEKCLNRLWSTRGLNCEERTRQDATCLNVDTETAPSV